jgi:hypothetical protein
MFGSNVKDLSERWGETKQQHSTAMKAKLSPTLKSEAAILNKNLQFLRVE